MPRPRDSPPRSSRLVGPEIMVPLSRSTQETTGFPEAKPTLTVHSRRELFKVLRQRLLKRASTGSSANASIPLSPIDYVGSLDRVDIRTVSNITARIRRLHMTNRDDKASGGITSANNLFHEFLKLANLLPPDTTLWGLCLAHQFHSALSLIHI